MKSMLADDYLDLALSYAKSLSGCNKVAVGSAIVKDGVVIGLGANRAIPDLCKTTRGCLRIEKYGEDSKIHRNPEDCRAIHSEIDAICAAAKAGVSTSGATIYVTRYPCENCAKALVAAGIKRVVYGGTTYTSEATDQILNDGLIDHYMANGWLEDDNDR